MKVSDYNKILTVLDDVKYDIGMIAVNGSERIFIEDYTSREVIKTIFDCLDIEYEEVITQHHDSIISVK